MDMSDAALVSCLSAQGGAVFRLCSPGIPRPWCRARWRCRTCCAAATKPPVYCQRVNQFENDADNITREVLTAVRRTFITPFDRVDIKNLITAMDDAIDQMQQTAKAVMLFEVRTFEPPMREIGTLLVECANLVGRALPLMQSIGENVSMLTAITEELTKLEGRVDDLHDIGLKELFLKHRDANTMDFIVGAEIYDHLEKVADRFDDVANEINSIVIEQV